MKSIKSTLILFLSLILFNCQGDGGASGPGASEAPVPTDNLYPQPEELTSPAIIQGWVDLVEASKGGMEGKGPFTIGRPEGNYEVSALLSAGEIIRLHALPPGGGRQQWYYLNQYLVPMFQETGRYPGGEYFERRFYFLKADRLLAARERRAPKAEDVAAAPWKLYEPAEENDWRLNPALVRESALKFVEGK